MKGCKKSSYALMLLIWLLILPVPVRSEPVPADPALIEALQRGGYNLYFRHEATDWSQHDSVNQENDWLSCDGSKIRQLSVAGRERAKRTGEFIRGLNIPVSEVLASPYCRTMDTAGLLGLGAVQATNEVINLRVAEYFDGRPAVIQTARELLARRPTPGTNRVIVAHGNVAREATPVYPGEGEMVIFRPDGKGRFTFVGRIAPGQWLQLKQAH